MVYDFNEEQPKLFYNRQDILDKVEAAGRWGLGIGFLAGVIACLIVLKII